MAVVRFTANLRALVEASELTASGSTVRQVMADAFRQRPAMRGYVLDDQDGVRHHMAVFVDGELVHDRRGLSDPVTADSTIDVIQALSGG